MCSAVDAQDRHDINFDALRSVNPLPQRYLTTDPGIGGVIKQRPEDFLVDEQPLYDPCGEGEHLYLGIEKRNVSHGELIATLRKHFAVNESAIGFAGMKDKHAVTRQMVSIYLPGREAPTAPLPHERIAILWAQRHANKLRRGHLAGNRFSIRIREVDPLKAPLVLRQLRALEQLGVPNYFGRQRFGYRRNNHVIGGALLAARWDAALDELLGSRGCAFPDYQRDRRTAYDEGKFGEAASKWTPADRAELTAAKALASGLDVQQAMQRTSPAARDFWISSLQSAVFNRVLDQRIDDDTLSTLIEGDLAWKHDTRRVFPVTAEELATGLLPPRIAAMEISPSGPLWGQGMTLAGGDVGRREEAALEHVGLTRELLEESRCRRAGSRRALRVPLFNADCESGIDEHGRFIRVAFDLPRGAYATVVLREIMKNDDGSQHDDPDGDRD